MRTNLEKRLHALRWLLRVVDPKYRPVITDAEALELDLLGTFLLRDARREPLFEWPKWTPPEPRKGLMRFQPRVISITEELE